MAYTPPDEIMLPLRPAAAGGRPDRSQVAAFVPITVALFGIAAILFGQISAGERAPVDPIATGSIHVAPAAAEQPGHGG